MRMSRLLILFFVLIAAAGCSPSEPGRLQIGDAAPDFTAKDIDGKTVALASLRGGPVVLRFFQPDCPYCQADTKAFGEYQKENRGRGLATVYVAEWQKESEVREFRDKLAIEFPVILDADGKLAASYSIRILPQTVIISPDGKIAAAMVGGVSKPQLAEVVEPFFRNK